VLRLDHLSELGVRRPAHWEMNEQKSKKSAGAFSVSNAPSLMESDHHLDWQRVSPSHLPNLKSVPPLCCGGGVRSSPAFPPMRRPFLEGIAQSNFRFNE